MRWWVIGAVVGLCLGGCTTTPPLQEDGVAVSDIVQRVKCELAYAVPDLRGKYPSGNFQWIKYWTAKVDLTLDVNDQSSLKPNINYVTPMPQVSILGTTFTRFWSVGAGGELSTQAQRTEKLSFTLSMKELMDGRSSKACELPNQKGLLGNLGLQEWVSSSLVPAANRQLTIGYHQPPSGKPATVAIAGPTNASQPVAPEPPALKYSLNAQAAVRSAEILTESAEQAAGDAKKAALKKSVQKTYDAVDRTYSYVEAANSQLDLATQQAWKANSVNRDEPLKLDDKQVVALKQVPTDVTAATAILNKAKTLAASAWDLLPHDSPLDSITHTSKFIVTTAANVTPNWQLVRFRGPGSGPRHLPRLPEFEPTSLTWCLGLPPPLVARHCRTSSSGNCSTYNLTPFVSHSFHSCRVNNMKRCQGRPLASRQSKLFPV